MEDVRNAAPERYMTRGRETIDRIRDVCHASCRDAWDAEESFLAWCIGQAIKYADRDGAKGDRAGDLEKLRFYQDMVKHIAGAGPDPRSSRPGFVPYAPQPIDEAEIRKIVTGGS